MLNPAQQTKVREYYDRLIAKTTELVSQSDYGRALALAWQAESVERLLDVKPIAGAIKDDLQAKIDELSRTDRERHSKTCAIISDAVIGDWTNHMREWGILPQQIYS